MCPSYLTLSCFLIIRNFLYGVHEHRGINYFRMICPFSPPIVGYFEICGCDYQHVWVFRVEIIRSYKKISMVQYQGKCHAYNYYVPEGNTRCPLINRTQQNCRSLGAKYWKLTKLISVQKLTITEIQEVY